MWNILFRIIGVLQTFFKQKIKWFYIILVENIANAIEYRHNMQQ